MFGYMTELETVDIDESCTRAVEAKGKLPVSLSLAFFLLLSPSHPLRPSSRFLSQAMTCTPYSLPFLMNFSLYSLQRTSSRVT
jgi:hypothetical protein